MTRAHYGPVADSVAAGAGVRCGSLTPGRVTACIDGMRGRPLVAAGNRPAGGVRGKQNRDTTPSLSIGSEDLLVQLLAICDVSLAVYTVLKEHAPATDEREDRTGGPRRERGRPVTSSRGTAALDHTSFSHT